MAAESSVTHDAVEHLAQTCVVEGVTGVIQKHEFRHFTPATGKRLLLAKRVQVCEGRRQFLGHIHPPDIFGLRGRQGGVAECPLYQNFASAQVNIGPSQRSGLTGPHTGSEHGQEQRVEIEADGLGGFQKGGQLAICERSDGGLPVGLTDLIG
ncbi:MAG TPA: hypothetical protein VGY99_05290 [Candidatus Binataceae bacterium]|nr:hypothetical protein [Candidatus Binataceae bacterium]